ncbi:MAG: hypothetical protein GXO26_00945 [Crenarchaeota archaeon]|nr:hypothetical protein [Thermoproteota archaeon]
MSLSRTVKHVSIFQALKPIIGPSSSHTTAPLISSFIIYRFVEEGILQNDTIHHVEINGREKGDLIYRGHRTYGAIIAGYRGLYFDNEDKLCREVIESSLIDPEDLKPMITYVQVPQSTTLENAAFKLCFISKYGDNILEAYSLGGGTIEPKIWYDVLRRYIDEKDLRKIPHILFDREFDSKRLVPLWLYLSIRSILSELCDAASRYFNKSLDELSTLIDERQRLYSSFSNIVKRSENMKSRVHEYVLMIEEKLIDRELIEKLLETYIDIVLRSRNRSFEVLSFVHDHVNKIFKVFIINSKSIDDVKNEIVNVASSLRGLRNTMFYAFITMLRVVSSRIIISAPTAGSAGILPAVLCTLYDMLGQTRSAIEELKRALIIAGLINAIAANRASTSGSLHGCQAEIGVALSMSAAAYAYILSNYNIEIAERAAVYALRTVLGLPCDPVLGFVEIPCIERNIILTEAAIAAAKLALSGSRPHMTLDNTIDAMRITGQLLPQIIKEQAYGPLSCIFLSEVTEKIENTIQKVEDTQTIRELSQKLKEILKIMSAFLRQTS